MNANGPHDHPCRTSASTAVGLVRITVRGLAVVLLGVVLLVASPANAERAPDPMLRISVDNGGTSAEAGDELDYTISVENLGDDAVDDLRVTQTMPEGLTFESADRQGSTQQDLVVWSVDLAPSRTLTLHTTMSVGATPDEVLRMATVACAATSAKKAPLVCATHSDELPAGEAARTREEADAQTTTNSSSGLGTTALIGLGGGAIVIAAAAVAMMLRRRRGVS